MWTNSIADINVRPMALHNTCMYEKVPVTLIRNLIINLDDFLSLLETGPMALHGAGCSVQFHVSSFHTYFLSPVLFWCLFLIYVYFLYNTQPYKYNFFKVCELLFTLLFTLWISQKDWRWKEWTLSLLPVMDVTRYCNWPCQNSLNLGSKRWGFMM